MAGLSLTLETARGALLNTQVQIQTASHNITNAESTDYARQKTIIASNYAVHSIGGWMGTGASVVTVTQSRDAYIEKRLLNSISDESYYGALSTELEIIQAVIADSGDSGISEALGAFWDSWDALAQDPANASNQTAVYAAAENLANSIKTTFERVNTAVTEEIPGKIEDSLDEANALIERIAELNVAIARNETATHKANDLRDLRYAALKELAALVPVTVTEDEDGIVTVSTIDDSGTETTLITGGTVETELDSDSNITGGKIGGLMAALEDAEGYVERLNYFAGELIEQVNAIHEQDDGEAVFEGDDAETITASTTFLPGPSTSLESDHALAIAQLQDTRTAFDDGKEATFNQYLADIQEEVGTDTSTALSGESFNTALRTELEAQQQEVSGVSIDEELVNILQYQHIYQAAAKVIDIASQMMNTIMEVV